VVRSYAEGHFKKLTWDEKVTSRNEIQVIRVPDFGLNEIKNKNRGPKCMVDICAQAPIDLKEVTAFEKIYN